MERVRVGMKKCEEESMAEGQWQERKQRTRERWHGINRSKIRDGMMIKLDVKNGVYTMDMWTCLDETGPVFSRQGR